jgi:hypothetical protein
MYQRPILRVSGKLILQSNRNLDIHTAQLLDEQLRRIRHCDASNRLFRFAQLAVSAVAHLSAYNQLALVFSSTQSKQCWYEGGLTLLTDIHIMRIRTNHQPLKQQLTRPIRNQTITFHLS